LARNRYYIRKNKDPFKELNYEGLARDAVKLQRYLMTTYYSRAGQSIGHTQAKPFELCISGP
jgi:hypothetical protein